MSAPTDAAVLVVDDDPDFLGLLKSAIEKIPGVTVNVAHGPSEAIRLLSRNVYDLIVSDWALEKRTAPDVFEQADRLISPGGAKVPVMFISGSEKVSQTHRLQNLRNFQPVSFLVKGCGASIIGLLAEQILNRFWKRTEVLTCGNQSYC